MSTSRYGDSGERERRMDIVCRTPCATRWRALFTGQAAGLYRRRIGEIVHALEHDHHDIDDADWGRPLLHAYLTRAGLRLVQAKSVHELLNRAVDAVAEKGRLAPALFGGIAGVGWLLAHIQQLYRTRDDETFEAVDEAMLRVISSRSLGANYDLINGFVGLGVYFLERLPSKSAVWALTTIVRWLEAICDRSDGFTTWHTPPQVLPAWQRELAPQGYYNLGVAHGIPGIIGLLAAMGHAGVSTAASDILLASAVRWLLHERPTDGFFPSWLAPGGVRERSRVAWCYGPLGLSATLLCAARHLNDPIVENCAIEIGLSAASRRGRGAGVRDGGLCHGSAGNGHLFNRLYQATGRPEFREASIYWFEQAIEMRLDGGIAGYLSFEPGIGPRSDVLWKPEPGFLVGATGIALAFLAATTTVEPRWDRVFLCSLTPLESPTVDHRGSVADRTE